MGRRAIVIAVGLVVLSGAGAACESTLNLGSGGDAAVAPDAALPTCESTCARLIDTCRLFAIDQRSACLAECALRGSAVDLACVARTPCGSILTACGDGVIRDGAAMPPDSAALDQFEITTCQTSCDSAQFFSCLDAEEHTTCRTLCASAPRAKRNAYGACQNGAGGNCPKAHDCFDQLTKD